MNAPKVNEYDYINFLIATQKAYSCTEAERVQPESWGLFATGISWYQAKLAIVRHAVRDYLSAPRFLLNPTA